MNVPGSLSPLSNPISGLLGRALSALLPNQCFLCGERSAGGLVCASCEKLLPRLDSTTSCPSCALPETAGQVCGRCLSHPPAYDATIAAYAYAFPLGEMIRTLKYGDCLALGRELGRRIAELAAGPWDAVLPVPLHRARLAERGFNQTVELAQPVALRLGLPLWRTAFERRRDTPTQAGLSARDRKQNLRGAFELRREVSGLSLLVVDDVMTTGATLDEVARVLKQHGATRVVNLVVARTPPLA